MPDKSLVQELRKIVRAEVRAALLEVIGNAEPKKQPVQEQTKPVTQPRKRKVEFKKNKFADILNDTDIHREQRPIGMSLNEMSSLNEDISFNSGDARGFANLRQNMKRAVTGAPAPPTTMQDPETGKTLAVPETVGNALVKDYSHLMKAIDKKKKGR